MPDKIPSLVILFCTFAIRTMFPVLLLIAIFPMSEAGHASTWESCGCYWGSWDAWSDCSVSCGGGNRYRSRWVWWRDIPGCSKFTDCATDDMGFEYDYSCNANCYHGTYSGGYCNCQTGWYGSCCNNRMYKVSDKKELLIFLYSLEYMKTL